METTERADILEAASRIYSGCLASGKVDSTNEAQVIRYALRVAVNMAHAVEKRNIFDGEDVPFPL